VGRSDAASASSSVLADADAAQPVGAVSADTGLHICQRAIEGPVTSRPASSSSGALSDGITLAHAGSNCSDSSDEEAALLLCTRQAADGSNSSSTDPASTSKAAACSSSSLQGRWQAVRCWWAQANEPEQRRATLRLLIYGSLAGSVSGAMAGMTGGHNE
jgi:hypothetical protein